ncbi:MAG: histidine kinase [Actinobacteria bacterium]|nr:histidine kinase [Actinomycetota bacterium]
MADSATTVRALPQNKQPRNPISRKQVEKVISRSVAVFGIAFGAQTIPWMLSQLGESQPVWLWVVIPALFGMLPVVLVFSILQVWVRPIQGIFAVLYLLAIITWPIFVRTDVVIPDAIHWLNYLITVATAMATIAFPTAVTAVYLFLCPAIYIVVRITPLGGGATWQLAVLEGVYALILGSAIVIIVTMLRQAASSVDGAQATALDRYSHAVRQHATEVERVQVDSIVHDSVLTTFISAARAFTPQAQALAATMAGNAIGYLRDAAAASPDDGTTVRFTALAERITDAAKALSSPFELRIRSVGTRSLPVQASEAIYSASVQAMVNSLQHAGEGDITRWVAVRGVAPGGIEIIIGDTGAGFDTSERSERLGVRVSIIERISNAGGRASIQSAPGEGTVVSIRWPHASAQQSPTLEEQS